MGTQFVYVLVSSEQDYYLEELWVSLYSLRQYHPSERVIVLTDDPTSERISQQPSLASLITETKVIPVPENYPTKDRSREIKTSIRNLIDGNFLFIDTDTVITGPLDDVDNLPVQNIAMVPELHGSFKNHLTYDYVRTDVKRIFDVDASDSPYWFNSGCMLVKDNQLTRGFFRKWNENWNHSAFNKGNSTDQRALLCTDKQHGYIIECLPDVYNCQVAMSIEYLYDAKIVHFWHMRSNFTPHLDYSPFCNKDIYRKIRQDKAIINETAQTILRCKSSFRTPSMLVGSDEIDFLFSPFYTVLGRSYRESKAMRWCLNRFIYLVNLYYRIKRKIKKNKS